mmetsp:Transcript_38512/g.115548  ORF Transcript_38512/g.115548 Transcript_38512/m.115548 type:complete len:89 (-) Transcript_38512:2382-2648(-)
MLMSATHTHKILSYSFFTRLLHLNTISSRPDRCKAFVPETQPLKGSGDPDGRDITDQCFFSACYNVCLLIMYIIRISDFVVANERKRV